MRILPVAVCAVLLTLTACAGASGTDSPAVAVISDSTTVADSLARGDCRSVAAPAASTAAGGTVLTVTPPVGSGRTGAVSLSIAQLDALPQVECTVDDRIAEGKKVQFQGVLMSTLLTHLGADQATTLSASALNDYSVDLPMSDVQDLPVLLATRMDGKPMSVAHYGPLRVIYPTTGYDLDPTVYDPRRIWQLSSIDIR